MAATGAESNPTGNPIGGGPGYEYKAGDPIYDRDILADPRNNADWFVSNKLELTNALAQALAGDIVYVDDAAEIAMGNTSVVRIPGGVTLASGRRTLSQNPADPNGAVISTALHTWPLFLANGPNVRFTGLRLRGPDSEIGDHNDPHSANAVQSEFPNLEVDNCEFHNWVYGFYLTPGCTNAFLHHNYIHHNRRTGLGYGISHGYATIEKPINSLIEANLFDHNRHSIASTGNTNCSYEARYNIVMEHHNNFWGHCFDVHGTGGSGQVGEGGTAGDTTLIHHNTFWDATHFAIWLRGKPRVLADISSNWFHHAAESNAIRLYTNANTLIQSNAYGLTPPAGTILPVAQAGASPVSGSGALTVSFDGSGSHDPDGEIISHHWDFGDGATALGAVTSHTFAAEGMYNVVLTVTEDNGIPARTAIPITVEPPSESYTLNFWVKDGYRGAKTGYYFKQALIDGMKVWEDDAAGDEGWQHVSTNVTSRVTGKATVTLTFRVYCAAQADQNNYIELETYWDDAVLFYTSITNGNFEALSGDWAYSQTDSPWEGVYFSGETRSGALAYRLYAPYGPWYGFPATYSYAQIEQAVRVYGGGVYEVAPQSLAYAAVYGGANPAPQTIAISNLSETAIDVSNSVAYIAGASGWLTLSPVTGAVLQAGSLTVTGLVDIAGLNAGTHVANIAVSSTNSINSPRVCVATLAIAKASQAITFGNPGPQLTTNLVGLVMTSDSGLAVTGSVISGNATIYGGTNLVFTGAGIVTIQASQTGNVNYAAAPPVTQTFEVARAPALVNLSGLSQTYNGTARPVTTSTVPAGLPLTMTYSGKAWAPTNAGSYAVTGVVDHAMYQGTSVVTLTIAKADQAITSFTPEDGSGFVTTGAVVLAAQASSGLAVTFVTNGGPALITGGTNLIFTGAGTVSISALQAGDANWNEAPGKTNTFNVAKATAPVFLSNLTQVCDGTAKKVGASTIPPGLAVVVTYDGNSWAPTNVGEYAVTGTVNDVLYQGSASGTLTIRVLPAPEVLPASNGTVNAFWANWQAVETATNYWVDVSEADDFSSYLAGYENRRAGPALTLSVTGLQARAEYYYRVRSENRTGVSTDSAPRTVSAAAMELFPGSLAYEGTYGGPSPVAQAVVLRNLGARGLVFTNTVTYGGASGWWTSAPKAGSVNGMEDVAIIGAVNLTGLNAGEYHVTNTISSAEVTNGSLRVFAAALTVNKAGQAITNFTPLNGAAFATTSAVMLAAQASSELPVKFEVVAGPGRLNGARLTFTGAGLVSVRALQAGNVNYLAAPTVTNTLVVLFMPPTAPGGVSASKGLFIDRVRVSWTAVGSASGYEIWRHTANTPDSAVKIEANIPGSPFNDARALPGTVYYYWIRAMNDAGVSGFSASDFGYARTISINDYNGDGFSEIAVFDNDGGYWYAYSLQSGRATLWHENWGWPGAETVPGDYDGDMTSDLAVYDQATGNWYIWSEKRQKTLLWARPWGWPGAETVYGDYDGDMTSDLAVYDQPSGCWYIITLDDVVLAWARKWGWPGAITVPGDYDGDRVDDLCVLDNTTGYWYAQTMAGTDLVWEMRFGPFSATAVPGDYDGDGKNDLAVYDKPSGNWYAFSLERGLIFWALPWGLPNAAPVPGDFDGDGKDDLAVFDNATGRWFIWSVAKGRTIAWAQPWGWPGARPPGAR